MKTITVHDEDQPHTLDVDSVDDIRHAQYVLACLGLLSADVDDDDDSAPRYVLRRDGPAVLTPADVHYRRANVIVTITVDGATRTLSGVRVEACHDGGGSNAKFSAVMGRHLERELRCMLDDADNPDELPF